MDAKFAIVKVVILKIQKKIIINIKSLNKENLILEIDQDLIQIVLIQIINIVGLEIDLQVQKQVKTLII